MVGAEGKFETNADTALLQFHISAQEESSPAAYDRAAQAAEQVRPILRARAVANMQMEAAAPAPREEFTPEYSVVTAHLNAMFSLS